MRGKRGTLKNKHNRAKSFLKLHLCFQYMYTLPVHGFGWQKNKPLLMCPSSVLGIHTNPKQKLFFKFFKFSRASSPAQKSQGLRVVYSKKNSRLNFFCFLENWLIDFWVIGPWNKSGEKSKCVCSCVKDLWFFSWNRCIEIWILLQQERMWNSFQGDRESGLFWLLSESIEKD